jgi:hypothetical protein
VVDISDTVSSSATDVFAIDLGGGNISPVGLRVREVFLVDRALTATELANVEAYLAGLVT